MEVYRSWLMLSVTLASVAVPVLTVAPWALSPRVTLSTSSTPVPALIAAPAPALAPWVPSLRAKMPKKTAPDIRRCFFALLLYTLYNPRRPAEGKAF